MNKSILIYNQTKFKNLFPVKNLNYYCGSILDVYFAKVFNPPFFKLIIFIDPQNDPKFIENQQEFIQKAWNMTLLNGHLIIPDIYQKYIDSKPSSFKLINNKKYAVYTKKDNKLYIFYDKYRVVDFMIIGVEKAGTTSALTNLSKHPQIYLAKPKHHPGEEMHYFNMHWNKGEKWYKSFFNYDYKCVGEKNPNIIYLDYMYPYIQQLNPCVKMILFLRNPIDRAYSAWHLFQVRNKTYIKNENRKTFQEMVEDELKNRLNEPLNPYVSYSHILQKGLYFKQIKKLLKYFPMQNLCILFLEDIEKNQENAYQKIYSFLEVDSIHHSYEKKLQGKYNKKQKNKDISHELNKKLIDFYSSDVQHLEKLLNVKTNWLK